MKSNAETSTEYNEGAWSILSVAMMPVAILLKAWAMCAIWSLTLVPEFGFKPLSAVGAFGIAAILQFGIPWTISVSKDPRKSLLMSLIYPPFTVLIVKFSIWLVAFVGWPS